MAGIQTLTCDQLDVRAPIFDSLHVDYPDFTAWFARAATEHRPALVVRGAHGTIAALAITKVEPEGSLGLRGPATKVCTLKVDAASRRQGLGTELLEHTIRQARTAGHRTVHVSAHIDRDDVRALVTRAGFHQVARPDAGQVTYARSVNNEVGRLALMSIHPRYAHAILAGTKRVELRKRRLAADVTHVVVYATAPVSQVIGAFEVLGQDTASPATIWDRHHTHAGIAQAPYDAYFATTPTAVAILVGDVITYPHPIALADLTGGRPPQSFAYLRPEHVQAVADIGLPGGS